MSSVVPSSLILLCIFLLFASDSPWSSSFFLPVTALLTSTNKRRLVLPHQRRHHRHHLSFRIRTSISLLSTSDQSAESSATTDCFPNCLPVSEEDRKVLQHQTGQVAPSKAALGIPSTCQCQHGYPQVFLLNPLSEKRMNSGLLKLTCPLLVNAIDQLEDDGYIGNFTNQVQSNEQWTESCQTRHQTHANARTAILKAKSTLDDDSFRILKQKLGDKGAKAFLNSGIAGATVDKPDVKCLHAWMGDYLFHMTDKSNDDKNSISQHQHYLGEAIAAALEERSIPIDGTLECSKFCNPSSSTVGRVPKARNKQRLKTQKEKDRRKRKKEREQAVAVVPEGDDMD